MKSINPQVPSMHPKPWSSMLAGFDAVTTSILVVGFPLLVDLFLWLGPHLRMKTLVTTLYNQITQAPEFNLSQSAEITQASKEVWNFLAEQFNLMVLLRSYPVGIPSLMAGTSPNLMPSGQPAVIDIASGIKILGLGLVLTLIGLGIGTFYYLIVSQISLARKTDLKKAFQQWPWATLQVYGLAFLWLAIFLLVSVPATCLLSLFFAGGIPMGQLVLFMYTGFLLWLFFPLFFSAHGIIVYRMNVWASVRTSIRLTRMSMPAASLFFLILFIISQVLDFVWRVPSADSLFTLIGILGHAFVSTGLLAASFIFYRDVNQWQQKVLGWLSEDRTSTLGNA